MRTMTLALRLPSPISLPTGMVGLRDQIDGLAMRLTRFHTNVLALASTGSLARFGDTRRRTTLGSLVSGRSR